MKKQSITIPSDMNCIYQVELFIDTIIDTFQLSVELHGCICVSVTQAVQDYILFANDGNRQKTLTITATRTEHKFIVTIQDEGAGLTFKGLDYWTNTSELQGMPGKGFYLMATLADELLFLKKGSKVKMTFYL